MSIWQVTALLAALVAVDRRREDTGVPKRTNSVRAGLSGALNEAERAAVPALTFLGFARAPNGTFCFTLLYHLYASTTHHSLSGGRLTGSSAFQRAT
jgi:hypothetical protein